MFCESTLTFWHVLESVIHETSPAHRDLSYSRETKTISCALASLSHLLRKGNAAEFGTDEKYFKPYQEPVIQCSVAIRNCVIRDFVEGIVVAASVATPSSGISIRNNTIGYMENAAIYSGR